MGLEVAKTNKENYCVNCKHYIRNGRRDACRNNLIVSSYINNVTGKKFYDDKPCGHTRLNIRNRLIISILVVVQMSLCISGCQQTGQHGTLLMFQKN